MDLFTISRDYKQAECVSVWIKNKCRGTIEACTGFGKTKVAIDAIKRVLKVYPNFRVLVIVPHESLESQWNGVIKANNLDLNVSVHIVNSAIKHTWKCDILVLDEIHRFAADTFRLIFSKIKYRLILGLTATLKRLDGKHEIVQKYCPIIETIPLEVAVQNGWVSDYVEYKVYIDTDLSEYKVYNKEFVEHFSFFEYNWKVAQAMTGKNGFKSRLLLADYMYKGDDKSKRSEILKLITYHAVGLMKSIRQRKTFINEHPKKIELAREIIKHRSDKKIITFSATTKMAEKIGIGDVFTGKDSKKKCRTTIKEFSSKEKGVLNTIKKADEGLDIPGLSVAVILGLDSSSIRNTQRLGRVIRKEPGKTAEIFTFVIRGTVEEEWFNKSHENQKNIITLDEEGLMHVLKGEPYEVCKKVPIKMTFRF